MREESIITGASITVSLDYFGSCPDLLESLSIQAPLTGIFPCVASFIVGVVSALALIFDLDLDISSDLLWDLS